MSLSSELISQFAKITNDKTEVKQESTVYGTTVEYDGDMYVQLDGSDLLTPISTTADAKAGERVMVLIKNHTATITGNVSSPAARTGTVQDLETTVGEIGTQISEFEVIIADKVDTLELNAVIGRVDQLTSDNVIIKEHLDANTADIESLEADNVTINEKLTAAEANIEELQTNKLDAESAEILFANIDFSNIGEAAIEKLFTESGIIKDLIMSDGVVTGELVGVTIKGDLIEAGTVKADKLVVLGSDGIYYKLNVEAGATTSEEVTEEELQNGLHGTAIIAKTITAEKIAVDDLVAFDATIGGFSITSDAIHSVVKDSATNTTRGIYMDNEGQMSFGDSSRYLRYYKDENGDWKLEIYADTLLFGTDGESVDTVLNGVITDVDEIKAKAEAAQSTADAAQTAADNAQTRADNAATAATDAQTAADEAKTKAEQAEADLAEVSSRVDATEEDIELATLAANTAKAEAEAAQSAADTAKAQAEQAVVDAENAKTQAETAQAAADAAQADVDALARRVTTAETDILQNSEEITLRAKKTEVDTALAEVNSRVDESVKEHHRYYLSQAIYDDEGNDISAPDKPTTFPPTEDWVETEPEYVSGNVIYTVECDVFMDDTFTYSDVSKSTIFEQVFEAKSELAIAEQNLQNVEARVGTTEEELESAKQRVTNAQAEVDALMEDLLTTKQTVAELKVQSDNINIEVTKIIDYGVDKVTTSMGYTFNDEGLHIQKPGQEIVNTLDDEGMSVTRGEEVMLQADKDGVIATDVKVRNFLIIGTHARFEDYTDGTDSKRTACFWIDG